MGNQFALSNVTECNTTKQTYTSNKPEAQAKIPHEELQKLLSGNNSNKPVYMSPYMRTLSDKEVEQLKKDGKLDETKSEEILKTLKEQVGKPKDKHVLMSPFMQTLTDEDIQKRKNLEEFLKKNPNITKQMEDFKNKFFKGKK